MAGLIENYKELANAIVELSVKDYIIALRTKQKTPAEYKKKKAIERFFCSGWFSVLSNLSGQELMKKINLKIREEEEKVDNTYR